MKKIYNVYIVGADWCHITNFLTFGEFRIVKNIKDADIVMYTGGADINPALYSEKVHPTTSYYSSRDDMEVEAFKQIPKGALIIGVCRGAQLLTALNGGKLIQHVTNHTGGSHDITTIEGEVMSVTSCHHQMMWLKDLPEDSYELLAWSTEPRSTIYCMGEGPIKVPDDFKEPEIVYYPNINALCIQGHPEWMNKNQPTVQYVNKLISKYLND